ncbi:hypothetical protein Zm00014a_037080 [Zea mays]|nr:hypothetical protein Zm00014a_037080 [Zea mays]
MYLGTC